METEMNKRQHRTAAAKACFEMFAFMQGWTVSRPGIPRCYNCIIQRHDSKVLERVQVKAVSQDGKCIQLKSSSRPSEPIYGLDDIEILAGVNLDTGEIYLMPWESCHLCRTSFSLAGGEYDKYLVWSSWNTTSAQALAEGYTR